MRIVLTGGGTAGHVVPNVALIEELINKTGIELLYIGSKDGPEKEMIKSIISRTIKESKNCSNKEIEFRAVRTGKLRRYLSWRNFIDAFFVIGGFFDARSILKEFKPDKVFSKGGFVSVPVVIAAWTLKIPIILHESDVTPGLANRICAKFAEKVCVSFEESKKFFRERDVVVTGNPVRKMIFNGDRSRGLELTGFNDEKPILLIMGGSAGAKQINDLTFDNLPRLLRHCQVAHITGKGKNDIKAVRNRLKDYKQFEYLNEELADIYACCDLIVSRAGANSLAEISVIGVPAVLIPLSREASRGDQIENARIFEKEGRGAILKDEKKFMEVIIEALKNKNRFKRSKNNATEKILALLT